MFSCYCSRVSRCTAILYTLKPLGSAIGEYNDGDYKHLEIDGKPYHIFTYKLKYRSSLA